MKPVRAKPKSSEPKQDVIFSCEICAKNFQHKGSYTDHLKTHANYDVKYECSECPCFFKNAGHLSVHIREAHNNNPVKKVFDCKTCSKTFASRQSLTEHKRQKHPSQSVVFHCKFCQRPYSSKNSLKWHINLNHNKDFKRSKCPYCPCDFKWPHHLKVHIRKAHIEKGHAPSDLLKNGLSSIRRKNNNCIVCQEKFEKKFDLMVHLKYVHKQELDIFKCCRCLAVFTLGNSLKIHLDEHRRNKTGFPGHKCDQCYPTSSPRLYEGGEKPEPEVDDGRTDIEKEIIDFELSLMENEDIRELIKYRLRHAKRPRRKRNFHKPDPNSDFDEFYETFVQKEIAVKDDVNESEETKSESPVMNGKGKYYCEKCKLHFQMRFSYITHLKDHTDTESQASTDTFEEIKFDTEKKSNAGEVAKSNEEDSKTAETARLENKSPKTDKKRETGKRTRRNTIYNDVRDIINSEDEDEINTETKSKKAVESPKQNIANTKTADSSTNIVIENINAKKVLLEDDNTEENDGSKIDMELRIKLPRLTNEELQQKNATFKCNLCEHTFALECNLEEHVRLSHGVEFEVEDLPKRRAINSRYQCVNCKEKFSSPLALNRHLRLESQLKKKQNKAQLLKTKEMRMKKREVTYKCKICKTGFTDSKRYTIHMRNHKDEKTEPKSPKKSNVMPVSPRQLRKEKYYECGKCEISFTSKLELLRHISDVHMAISPNISPPNTESEIDVVSD